MRTSILFRMLVGLSLVLGGSVARAATLASDLPSPQPAGTTITFTIGGANEATELYRLSVGSANEPEPIGVVYDYSRNNVLEWTVIDPGTYRVVGATLNTKTGQESVVEQVFTLRPAVSPPPTTSAVVLPTRNPLVALYVAPPCQPPALTRVHFFAPSVGIEQTTSPKQCAPNKPLHFYVAGMRENTSYQMQHQILSPHGAVRDQAPLITFTTERARIAISPNTATIPSDPQASAVEPVIWNSPFIGLTGVGNAQATDLDGHLIWYLDEPAWLLRPSHEGTFWLVKRDPVTGIQDNLLAKVDLLGNVVKQTSVEALNHQLQRLGYVDRITNVHHDVRDLPNGDIAFISTVERLVTDVQGPGQVSVIGDMILVTNRNFELQWIWNGWDHLDPARLATLGETCTPGAAGCPPFFLADITNDWMHANAVAYTPDGNLILSVRNQDWILKINYANGVGDGRILWRLGLHGDFTLVGDDEDDWFSHLHDPSFVSDNRIVLFDNSNRRCASATPPTDCQSRGQVWEIDENAMTAELVFNQDLGEYAPALGSSQRLLNGNYWFNSGMLGTLADPRTTIQESDPSTSTRLQSDLGVFQYRSYRLSDLYTAPWSWGPHRRIQPEGRPKRPDRPYPRARSIPSR
jgi:arylsulfate sulfotransferase